MNKDYIQKLKRMHDEVIIREIYEQSTDTILRDLKNFQSFLCRNFKNHQSYDNMRPKADLGLAAFCWMLARTAGCCSSPRSASGDQSATKQQGYV